MKISKDDIEQVKKQYAPNRAMCGKPVLHADEKNYLYFVVKESGAELKVEYCPECEKINKGKTVKRECLKCRKSFTPGCKYRFTCMRCSHNNAETKEEWL